MPTDLGPCEACGIHEDEEILFMDFGDKQWCFSCLQKFLNIYGDDALSSWSDEKLKQKLLEWSSRVKGFDSTDWFQDIMGDIPGGY